MQYEQYGSEECWKEVFSFLVETIETAVKSWHDSSKVDPRVYFLLDSEKTQTDKYAPAVNIDKVLNPMSMLVLLLLSSKFPNGVKCFNV